MNIGPAAVGATHLDLPEAVVRFDLGLAIVRELAEAHGGRIDPGRSLLGGLRAEVRVPLPR